MLGCCCHGNSPSDAFHYGVYDGFSEGLLEANAAGETFTSGCDMENLQFCAEPAGVMPSIPLTSKIIFSPKNNGFNAEIQDCSCNWQYN